MSRYDLFRRRIAPIAFIVALALLARESCQHQRLHATFVIDYGTAEPGVRAIDVEVWAGGEQLATFHRAVQPDGHVGVTRFVASLPAEDGELHIDVELARDHRRFVRRFHATDDALITVPIASELVRGSAHDAP